MLMAIGIVLIMLWLFGFTVHFLGAFINLLLLAALVVIVYDLMSHRRI